MSATIKFGTKAVKETVLPHAIDVLTDILTKSNNVTCTITSTMRSEHDQARIMYNNCVLHGSESQLKLYKSAGQSVIQMYRTKIREHANQETIIAAMEEQIKKIGGSSVSHHCGDFHKLCVIDIDPNSILNKTEFILQVNSDKRVSKFLQPPTDPAYHLEIPIV